MSVSGAHTSGVQDPKGRGDGPGHKEPNGKDSQSQQQRRLMGQVGQSYRQGCGNTEDGPRVWPGLRDGFQEEMPPSGPKANLRAAMTTVPTSDTHIKTGLSKRLAGTPECPRSAPGEFHRGCMRLAQGSPSAPPSPGSGTSPPHQQAGGIGLQTVGRWLWYKFRALCFLCLLITSHFSPSCLRPEQLP